MPSLHEISQLVKEIGIKGLQESPEQFDFYADYVNQIDTAGVNALADLPREDATSALALLQSVAIAQMIARGEVLAKDINFLKSDKFSTITAIIFKLSVGMACLEELR